MIAPALKVEAHPSAFLDYARFGWKLCRVPSGTKGPTAVGWNLEANAIDPASIPPGDGAGVLHAFSGTCALDIDNMDAATTLFAAQGIDLQSLLADPGAVQIDSGNPGHGKLLFKLAMPLPSKRISHNGITAFEFRCGTSSGTGKSVQDVLPPSAHPSGTTYRWAGKGNWQHLPELPEALLTWWQSLCIRGTERIIKSGTISTSFDEIRSALFAVDPSCGHQVWIECLMAVHDAAMQLGEPEMGLALVNEWSAGSPTKYQGAQEVVARWRSFTPGNGISIGTLMHHAKGAGWQRPPVDVSAMFSDVRKLDDGQMLSGVNKPVPLLDVDLLPPVLAQRAREVAGSVGCDVVVPAWAGLAAIAAAANATTRLELVPGFEVPPVLWLMTIGAPADKKTPGSKPMMSILGDIEREDVQRYKSEMLFWQAQEAAHAAAMKAYLSSAAASPMDEHFASGLTPVPDLPPAPVSKRLTINDITSQKLVRVCEQRPEGVLCYMDEMAAWTSKMASVNSGEDRSCWVVSYEAMPYSMDRVGAGEIRASNLAVSIFGNIQPRVFQKVVPEMAQDGLLQRFLPAALRAECSTVGQPLPDWLSTRGDYERMIRRVHAQPSTRYRLSREALETFNEFMWGCHDLRARERLLMAPDVFMTALGKIEGVCGRLALAMHLAESPDVPAVSGDLMRRAVDLIHSFVIPSIHYAFADLAGAQGGFEAWVRDFIVQVSDQVTITLAEIRAAAKAQLDGVPMNQQAELIRHAMIPLELDGWATIVDDTGRIVRWAIHPEIQVMYAEHRARVIQAKQDRQMDSARMLARLGRPTENVANAKGWGSLQNHAVGD
jgi:hypothetical protein